MTRAMRDLFPALLIYGLFLVLAHPFGNFPLNDDWMYTRDALFLSQHGKIHYVGMESPWSFPQVLMGAGLIRLFGFSHILLRIFGIIGAWTAALLLSVYLKKQVKSDFLRSLVLIAFLFFPPNFVNGLSFMTDQLFLVFWMLACLTWSRAFENPSRWSVFSAGLMTSVCTAQRQFGIVLTVFAFIYASILFKDKRRAKLPLFLIATAAQIVAFLALSFSWTQAMGVSTSRMLVPAAVNVPAFDGVRLVFNLYVLLNYLGLATSPFLLMDLRSFVKSLKKKSRLNSLCIGVGISFMAVAFALIHQSSFMPYLDNQISKFGMFGQGDMLNGEKPVIFSRSFEVFLTLLSAASAGILTVRWIQWVSQLNLAQLKKPSSFFILSGVVYLLALLYLRDEYFDRYLIPVFCSGLVFVVGQIRIPTAQSRTRHQWIAGALSALFIVGSFSIGEYYMRWNEARWKVCQWAVARGFRPDQIDGGHEWNHWWKYPKPNAPAEITARFSSPQGLVPPGHDPAPESILQRINFKSWAWPGSIVIEKTAHPKESLGNG